MLAHSIETKSLGEQDVIYESLVRRGGQATLRPIPLIKNQPERKRSAVEDKSISLGSYRTKSSVTLQRVDDMAILVDQLERRFYESGRCGAPKKIIAKVIYAGI